MTSSTESARRWAAVNAVQDARDKVTGSTIDLFVTRVEALLGRVN